MSLPSLLDLRSRAVSVASIERHREDMQSRKNAFGITTVESPSVQPHEELSLMQRLALLGMMNSSLARGVARKISAGEGCRERPSFGDYHALAEKGLADKDEAASYHELTGKGFTTARRVLSQYCRDLDIHIMQDRQLTGETEYRCSCGGWIRVFKGNGQFTWRRANSAFRSHYNPEARGVEF